MSAHARHIALGYVKHFAVSNLAQVARMWNLQDGSWMTVLVTSLGVIPGHSRLRQASMNFDLQKHGSRKDGLLILTGRIANW